MPAWEVCFLVLFLAGAVGIFGTIGLIAWLYAPPGPFRVLGAGAGWGIGLLMCTWVISSAVKTVRIERERQPLVIHDHQSRTLEFPELGTSFSLLDVVAIEYVIGWIHFVGRFEGRHASNWIRIGQAFIRLDRQGGEPEHICFFSHTYISLSSTLPEMARAIGVPYAEYRLSRRDAPSVTEQDVTG